jgi:hypothetical protein
VIDVGGDYLTEHIFRLPCLSLDRLFYGELIISGHPILKARKNQSIALIPVMCEIFATFQVNSLKCLPPRPSKGKSVTFQKIGVKRRSNDSFYQTVSAGPINSNAGYFK